METVSVLLATYNGEKFLREQLDSLLKQTYTNFKIYISDDLSNDNTISIIEEYLNLYPSKIINIENKVKHGNARDNFLDLLLKVESDYYFFCDQDDIWHEDKIELTLRFLQANENGGPVVVFTDLLVVDKNLSILEKSFMSLYGNANYPLDWHYYIQGNNAPGCTMCFNDKLAKLYQQNANIIKNDNILMHDSLLITIASVFGKVYYLPKQTMMYRQHENNSVGADNRNTLKYLIKKLNLTKARKGYLLLQKQAGEIAKLPLFHLLPELEKNVICEYSILYKKNKINRIMFMVKNKLVHKDFIRFIRWLFII